MTALPQRFPAKKISSRRLLALAEKARAAHAAAESAPEASAAPQRTSLATPREGLRIGGLTWLELSAVAAILLLGALLAARWLPSHATQNRSVQNEAVPVEEKSASNRVGEEGVKTPDEKPKPAPEPMPTPTADDLPALVKSLSSDDFETREAAEKRLLALDTGRLDEVEKFQKDASDVEVKARLKRVAADMRDRKAIEAFLLDRKHNDIFGQRFNDLRATMVRRYGGDERTEEAVEDALDWLMRHQEADGHWDTVKYGSPADTDLPATAFAMMAFMAAGNHEFFGKYKDNMKRGIAWLISCQQKSGVYMRAGQTTIGYQHALAAIAVTEAAAMSKEPAAVKSAQKALTYSVEVHQAADGGWRYQPGGKDSDLSITSWFMQQLKLAQYVPLKVPAESLKLASGFIDRCQTGGKDRLHLYTYAPGGQASASMTAAGCFNRQLFDGKREDLQKGVDGFIAQGGVPAWGEGGKSVELYYWYYGTHCAFQQGGEVWRKWNAALKTALVENQLKQGDEKGMWSSRSGHMASMGCVGQTAVATLCLEVYYRYPKFPEK
ncbi:MAG: terpene cyclase/mutase family protein [Planctomycetes bacterium]|nr:terpene cyclase/mutase family protein [Planctomycetota bacterium]